MNLQSITEFKPNCFPIKSNPDIENARSTINWSGLVQCFPAETNCQFSSSQRLRRARLPVSVGLHVQGGPEKVSHKPTAYGWRSTTGGCPAAVVTDLKPAKEAIVELVRCKCRTERCRGNCTCLVAGMACTQMCRCDAHPENCDNVDPVSHNDDGEDDDNETVYHFPYYNDNTNSVLAASSGVHVDEDVDNIVHLSAMETDCADI